jgi:hypothetical protein
MTKIRAGVELSLHFHTLHVACALLADTARQGLPLVASLLAAYPSGWQHHPPGLESLCLARSITKKKHIVGFALSTM